MNLKATWQSREKLHKARTKLQDAAKASKTKAQQAKARRTISDLEGVGYPVKARQADTRACVVGLKYVMTDLGRASGWRGSSARSERKPLAKALEEPQDRTPPLKPAAEAAMTS